MIRDSSKYVSTPKTQLKKQTKTTKRKPQFNKKMGKIFEQTLEKLTQVVNKHMKRYSTLMFIRKMWNKTTVWYHYIPILKAKVKKDWLYQLLQ